LTLALLLFAYLFSQFFRSFVAIIAAELTRDLGFGPRELGWVTAAWFAAFALAQFPVGYLLDTAGPRRTMGGLMIAGVAGALVFALSSGLPTSLLGMALIGVGCAPLLMGSLFIFGRTRDAGGFAMAAALLIGLGNLGNLAAATPLAIAAQAFGWRASMAAVGLAMGGAALLLLLFLKDPPPAARPAGKASILGDVLAILRIRALWFSLPLHLVGYAAIATERGLWVGPYLDAVHGVDAVARGDIALLMSVGMALGALACGPAAKWLGGPKPPALAATAITAMLFAALALWPKPPLGLATALLALIGFFGLTYSLLLGHGRSFVPDHLLGRGVTCLNFLAIGGAGLMQAVTGAAMEQQLRSGVAPADAFANVHLGMAIVLFAGAALFLRAPGKP
jgi:MFS family permease